MCQVSHPRYNAIQALSNWGIVNGYGDGTFGPGNGVRRAQFAKMAAGMFNLEVTENMSSAFTDLGVNRVASAEFCNLPSRWTEHIRR